MKKNLLVVLTICTTFCANAQLGNKDQFIASGLVSSAYQKYSGTNPITNPNTQVGINVSLALGKFVEENIIHQIGLSSYIQQLKGTNPNAQKSTQQGISLFYNSFKLNKINKNWFWTIIQQPSIQYNYNSSYNNVTNVKQRIKGYGLSYSAIPAIYFKLKKKWSVNATLSNVIGMNVGYNESKNSSNAYIDKVKTFNLQAGFWSAPLQNINIGINYIW